MDVRTCRSCKRIFNYLTGPTICPGCREKLEAKFGEVKAYIQEHRGANMQEVSEECDVEMSQIRQWLREERLELMEGSAIMLNCESCGKSIRCGRFCDACRTSLANNFQSMVRGNAPTEATLYKKDKESPKMRFL